MSEAYRISKLAKADKPSFVALLSRAFARDPLFLHVFGDSDLDSKARDSVTAFVSFMFDKSFLLNEEVWGYFEEKSLLGIYVTEKPRISKLQQLKDLALIGRLIPLFFQLPGSCLGRLNSYMRVTRSAVPPAAHHYLIMIGVEPEAQGKGIGRALLKHLLETAAMDKHSHGVALDTENKANVNWYLQFGFTLSKEVRLGHLPVYCMFYSKT